MRLLTQSFAGRPGTRAHVPCRVAYLRTNASRIPPVRHAPAHAHGRAAAALHDAGACKVGPGACSAAHSLQPAPMSSAPASFATGWAQPWETQGGPAAGSAAGSAAPGPIHGTGGYTSAGEEDPATDSDIELDLFVGRGSEASQAPDSPSSACRLPSLHGGGQPEGEEADAARQLQAAVSGAHGAVPRLSGRGGRGWRSLAGAAPRPP